MMSIKFSKFTSLTNFKSFSAKKTERENGAPARLKKSSDESNRSEKTAAAAAAEKNKVRGGGRGPRQNTGPSSPPKSPTKSKYK